MANSGMRSTILGGALTLLLATSCAVTPVRRHADVSDALRERVGHGTSSTDRAPADRFPPGTTIEDGLSRSEAVAVALWNNPAFRAELARLGLSRADVVEAGLLKNPLLSLLLPAGPKQFEANIAWQVESLWRRPRRVAMAQLNVEGVAEGLVRNGLDLVLETRLAYTESLRAAAVAGLAVERAALLTELDTLSAAQLRAGEISGLEADAAHLARVDATMEADRRAAEARASTAVLAGLLGLAADPTLTLRLQDSLESATGLSSETLPALSTLLDRSLTARPDLRAAELAIEAAGKQLGLSRANYVSLTAIIDANGDGSSGFESGPGIAAALPLFDRGQADKARAAAAFERAAHEYAAVRNRIATELRVAYVETHSARSALRMQQDEIVRLQGEALRLTELAHAAGDQSYHAVVVSRVANNAALTQHARVSAELLAAQTRLERALGSELDRPLRRIARSE